MATENETLRWPTNLDRAGIEKRLVLVSEAAKAQGLARIVSLFENLAAMSPAQLGAAVVGALTLVQDTPDQRPIAMQLEMVAMNLKNLKTPK